MNSFRTVLSGDDALRYGGHDPFCAAKNKKPLTSCEVRGFYSFLADRGGFEPPIRF